MKVTISLWFEGRAKPVPHWFWCYIYTSPEVESKFSFTSKIHVLSRSWSRYRAHFLLKAQRTCDVVTTCGDCESRILSKPNDGFKRRLEGWGGGGRLQHWWPLVFQRKFPHVLWLMHFCDLYTFATSRGHILYSGKCSRFSRPTTKTRK